MRPPSWHLIATGALIATIAAPAWAVPQLRPRVLVLSADGEFAPYERRVADAVEDKLKALPRFTVLSSLESGAGGLAQGRSRWLAIARAHQAQVLVVLEFTQDPQAYYARSGDLTGRYASAGTLVLRVFEGEAEKLVRAFSFSGQSPGSRELAEYQAQESVVSDVVRTLQDQYRLTTRIVARDGRTLTLAHGREIGLQEGTLLAGTDQHGLPLGSLQVVSVASASARARLLRGYYDLAVGQSVVEQAYAGAPGGLQGIKVGFYGPTPGTLVGASMEYNRSGVDWGAGLDFGTLDQGGATGFALVPRWIPQFELWPERLWGYGELGAGLSLLTQPMAGSTTRATSYAASGVVGAGLAGRIGSVGLTVGLTYWTPWTAALWRMADSSGATTEVSSRVPHPTLGGWGTRIGLGWDF